jgi:hypothetical protein
MTLDEFTEYMRNILLNYDKKEHYKLLDQQDKERATSVYNQELDKKLSEYSIILLYQLHWEIRDQYVELVTKFMENKIETFELITQFEKRFESIIDIRNILISNRVLLSPDERSLDFHDLLITIYDDCQAYDNDPMPYEEPTGVNKIEFNNMIKSIYPKLKLKAEIA